jgi:aspartyl/glutamyl-tRNA(Asn/Gln) amidotransferase C subunit
MESEKGVSLDVIKNTVKLAGLKFSEDELIEFKDHFTSILSYMQRVSKAQNNSKLDNHNALELTALNLRKNADPLELSREDNPTTMLTQEEATASSPNSQDGYFIVPLIVE